VRASMGASLVESARRAVSLRRASGTPTSPAPYEAWRYRSVARRRPGCGIRPMIEVPRDEQAVNDELDGPLGQELARQQCRQRAGSRPDEVDDRHLGGCEPEAARIGLVVELERRGAESGQCGVDDGIVGARTDLPTRWWAMDRGV